MSKNLYLFAGVNGVGKSTMYNSQIEEGKSFNEETTLTGKTILKTIDRAKELGYKIYLYYIGVDSPEIAKERVRNRVLKGGHDISSEVIEKRYYESLENLKKIISKCNYVDIYDNTDIYKLVFSFANNEIIKNSISSSEWSKEAIREKINSMSNFSVKEAKQEKNNNLKERSIKTNRRNQIF